MSQFEFFLTLASVVMAIGVAEVAGGWGRQLRAGDNVQSDWLHLGWTIAILLNGLVYWIGIWPYSDIEFLYVGQVFFLVIPTIFFVLLCFAITPVLPESAEFSVRDYYLEKRREIFLAYTTFLAMSVAADLAIAGIGNVLSMVPAMIIMACLLLLVFFRNVILHSVVMLCALAWLTAVAFFPLNEMYGLLGS
jgi:hypothetical protein